MLKHRIQVSLSLSLIIVILMSVFVCELNKLEDRKDINV